MKTKKMLAVLGAVAIIVAQNVMLPVEAAAPVEPTEEVAATENEKATYLIASKSLYVSNSSGQLCINGSTVGVATMKSIGFINIEIEYSTNGVSGWSHYSNLSSVLNTNALRCDFNNRLEPVAHGYYYRVNCDHYAKETGVFPRTQSEPNTSNVVYI